MFRTVEQGLAGVIPVFQNRDLSGALNICRSEYHLDRMFKSQFDRIMASLRLGNDIEDLLTTLFIFRYLERIGDAMLNIGEALLFRHQRRKAQD